MGTDVTGPITEPITEPILEPILGAIYRADADSITGWCWNPLRPNTQCGVDVLVDGEVWRELVANRRHEGARLNGPPHDHFGYLVALPEAARGWHRLEVREQRTGQVFGRLMQGGVDWSADNLAVRIDAVRQQAAEIGAVLARATPQVPIGAGFGAVGAALRGPALAAISLPEFAVPRLSVVVTGCADWTAGYQALASLAGFATDQQAEVLLMGGDWPELARLVRGVRLLGDCAPGSALAAARGDDIFVQDASGNFILGMKRADYAAMARCEAPNWRDAVAELQTQANLLGANLLGANLLGANLLGANLLGANLLGAMITTC